MSEADIARLFQHRFEQAPILEGVPRPIVDGVFPTFRDFVVGTGHIGGENQTLNVIDFDGVLCLGNLKSLLMHPLGKADFNRREAGVEGNIQLLKERGPVIITTNRLPVFNSALKIFHPHGLAEFTQSMDIPLLETLDRQNPFRDDSSLLLGKARESIRAACAGKETPRILSLVFDIRNGIATATNDLSTLSGYPWELHSLRKIIKAASSLGIHLDETHISMIDRRLNSVEP